MCCALTPTPLPIPLRLALPVSAAAMSARAVALRQMNTAMISVPVVLLPCPAVESKRRICDEPKMVLVVVVVKKMNVDEKGAGRGFHDGPDQRRRPRTQNIDFFFFKKKIIIIFVGHHRQQAEANIMVSHPCHRERGKEVRTSTGKQQHHRRWSVVSWTRCQPRIKSSTSKKPSKTDRINEPEGRQTMMASVLRYLWRCSTRE